MMKILILLILVVVFSACVSSKNIEIEEKASTIAPVIKSSTGNWSEKAPKELTWTEAAQYCANLKEGGYSEWRLPTISELRSLIESCSQTEKCNVTDKCKSRDCFNDYCLGCISSSIYGYSVLDDKERLWSDAFMSNDDKSVWVLDYFNGSLMFYSKDELNFVRCVR